MSEAGCTASRRSKNPTAWGVPGRAIRGTFPCPGETHPSEEKASRNSRLSFWSTVLYHCLFVPPAFPIRLSNNCFSLLFFPPEIQIDCWVTVIKPITYIYIYIYIYLYSFIYLFIYSFHQNCRFASKQLCWGVRLLSAGILDSYFADRARASGRRRGRSAQGRMCVCIYIYIYMYMYTYVFIYVYII